MANVLARLAGHSLWLAGFRPFFALAMLSGLVMPILWILVFAGRVNLPATAINPLQWHAHEMFFGFGWAVMGGFLLTATKNWVNVRGWHGAPLIALVFAWGMERVALWNAGLWPEWLFLFGSRAFLASIVGMLLWTLIRYRRHDSYRDNVFFLVLLPVFLLAKHLLLDPEQTAAGVAMTLALFRLAFLVMLERTMTQFMKGVLQLDILRRPQLDLPIKGLALALVAAPWLPMPVVVALEALLAALLLIRLAGWHPFAALARIDLGIMILGYLGIVAHLLLDLADRVWAPGWVGTLTVHVFTFGVMGLVIPAMLIRIVKGHTGRKAAFDPLDKGVLYLMLAAFVARIGLTQALPELYLRWLEIAATCWLLAFAILAWRYLPFLFQPRVDGREH